jgi:tetratricopeptide (TPR) repeat protein
MDAKIYSKPALAALLAAALGCSGGADRPAEEAGLTDEIPRVGSLSDADPRVAQLIENGIAMIEADPTAALPRAGLGMIYHANEVFEGARSAYRQALSIEPDNARWLYHLARVEERLSDSEAAIATIGRSIELEPRYAPSYWRRGGWLLDLGRAAEAEADFREAIEIAPDDPAGLTGLARALLEQDRAAEAAEILEDVVLVLPDDPLVHLLLGNAYRALGRMDAAAAHLRLGQGEQVTREDTWTASDILRFKLSFGAQMQMAVTLGGAGQLEQAIGILEQLRDRDPEDARVLRVLGRDYMLVGRNEEALATLDRGVELHPDDPKMLGEVAAIHHATGDSQRALGFLDRAIAIKPEDALAHARRGVILQSFKRYADAAESFARALVYRPRDTVLMRRRGDCLSNLNEFETASASYRDALAIAPDDPEMLVRLGYALHRLGRYPAAEGALSRALELSPGNPEWAKLLAEVRRLRRAEPAGQG